MLDSLRSHADTIFFMCGERERVVTWRKLHLSEAFDWRRDAVSVHQDVKLLPDALMSGVWHIQDVARCLPAIKDIQG